MNWMIDGFLSWPLWLRAALLLLFVVGIFWGLLGRQVLWVLSFLPFLLSKLFRLLYMAVEIPVAMLHKKFGSSFYDLENGMSRVGSKVDSWLLRWYEVWHCAQKRHLVAAGITYIALVFLIGIIPSLAGSSNSPIAVGQRAYVKCETAIIEWFEARGWYLSPEKLVQEGVFIQVNNRHILQNGILIEVDFPPLTRNEKTFVPIRTIVDVLEGDVDWDTETQSSVIHLNGKELKLSTASRTVAINGSEVSLEDRPIELNQRIYVGVREVLELLGYHVVWYGEEEIMLISRIENLTVSTSLFQEIGRLMN